MQCVIRAADGNDIIFTTSFGFTYSISLSKGLVKFEQQDIF